MSLSAEAVFEAYYHRVYRLGFSLSGDASEAEDIAQEVFVAVVRGISRFRGDAEITTWLYRITVRVAARHVAKRQRSGVRSVDLDEVSSTEQVERQAYLASVIEAISKLSVAQRTVLSLVSIEGLSHREVARVLGVPEGTVWSRLHAARKQLMKQLK
ncbi:MAG: RNA polymerase sigma factor [Pseudomonadales bacterium]|jgi:RNA polymerase sigma-70 factor (ECF subfamily)|nr:RNA polymerase sigma factor [Pseudomonadales bacterium]MDP7596882.1 RNA polymerase sigma factor [Pseudomonadales bacterium]HJN51707.1 RNA polymerase sigma factor [Pseudomonadales bacterium]|tara:strand:- start:1171 stop:1641 length:471 start_codon:yes stop_codon:yes gene_type:complete